MRKFVVSRYEIDSEKLDNVWSGTRIVVLSDFHNNSYGLDTEELYKAIEKENPEFLIVAGDMYTGEPGCDNSRADKFLRRISEKYTVYYGMGNHEHRIMSRPKVYPDMYESFEKMIKDTGIRLLQNETVELEKNGSIVAVHGLMIGLEYYEYYKKFKKITMTDSYIENLIGRAKTEVYNILIAHQPKFFNEYAKWGADLVISGHVHGGMARVPLLGGVIGPDYRLFPKYDKGRFEQNDATMILSAGIGMHTINIRPFNPPELVVIELK